MGGQDPEGVNADGHGRLRGGAGASRIRCNRRWIRADAEGCCPAALLGGIKRSEGQNWTDDGGDVKSSYSVAEKCISSANVSYAQDFRETPSSCSSRRLNRRDLDMHRGYQGPPRFCVRSWTRTELSFRLCAGLRRVGRNTDREGMLVQYDRRCSETFRCIA